MTALCHSFGLKVPFPQGVEVLKGLKAIDKVIVIDQSPIGRTPRSNPATSVSYTHLRAHETQ